MIITISGSAGSGKSTCAKLLAKRLGYNHYSMGDMRRKMAQDRGMTLAQLNTLGETEDLTDKEIDEYQKELGLKEDNFVIDGRLSFHFIPHSVKVYIDADEETRAQRIFGDERDTEAFDTLQHAHTAIVQRQKSDSMRYKKYYNLDCNDTSQYDFVVNSTDKTPENVVEEVIRQVELRK